MEHHWQIQLALCLSGYHQTQEERTQYCVFLQIWHDVQPKSCMEKQRNLNQPEDQWIRQQLLSAASRHSFLHQLGVGK